MPKRKRNSAVLLLTTLAFVTNLGYAAEPSDYQALESDYREWFARHVEIKSGADVPVSSRWLTYVRLVEDEDARAAERRIIDDEKEIHARLCEALVSNTFDILAIASEMDVAESEIERRRAELFNSRQYPESLQAQDRIESTHVTHADINWIGLASEMPTVFELTMKKGCESRHTRSPSRSQRDGANAIVGGNG